MSKRIITLGTWSGKPIEWIVLKEESFGTLVLCKEYVFNMSLSWSGTWASCNFRTELNGNFFSKAFTDDEKKKIVCTLLNPELTKDNIFLLSEAEASNLMTENERRFNNFWYLRTPYNSNYMKYIYTDGCFSYGSDTRGIRPAMYIKEK